jgi:hypothetical protein
MQRNAAVSKRAVWLAIIGYAVVASGLPLPVGSVARPDPASPAAKRLAGKDRSRPFPCMDKACGCDTAERCFTSCCCHSPAETLAWAKTHRVEPAVLTALQRRVACAMPTVVKAPEDEPSCCSAAPEDEPSCCASPAIATGKAPADEPDAEQPPEVEPRSRTATLRAMLVCGGIVAEWFAAGVAVPPLAVEVSLPSPVNHVCLPADEAGDCQRAAPAAPPPRAA